MTILAILAYVAYNVVTYGALVVDLPFGFQLAIY